VIKRAREESELRELLSVSIARARAARRAASLLFSRRRRRRGETNFCRKALAIRALGHDYAIMGD